MRRNCIQNFSSFCRGIYFAKYHVWGGGNTARGKKWKLRKKDKKTKKGKEGNEKRNLIKWSKNAFRESRSKIKNFLTHGKGDTPSPGAHPPRTQGPSGLGCESFGEKNDFLKRGGEMIELYNIYPCLFVLGKNLNYQGKNLIFANCRMYVWCMMFTWFRGKNMII